MMNRIVFNTIVRTVRVNPTTRTIAPYRWVSLVFLLNSLSRSSNSSLILFFRVQHKLPLIKQDKDQIYQLLLQVVLLFFLEVSHEAIHVHIVTAVHNINQISLYYRFCLVSFQWYTSSFKCCTRCC
jgi:hypothetical protein